MEIQDPRRKRRRTRRHRRRKKTAGLMANAHRSHPPSGELECAATSPNARRSTPAAHPARQRGAQDAEGFYQVHSKRFGRVRSTPRRTPPRSPSFLPQELEGACYRCLRFRHVRARCLYPARYYHRWAEGHHASECPARCRDRCRPYVVGPRANLKRGRSPHSEGERRAAARQHFQPRHSSRHLVRAGSAVTVSGRDASTGNSSVHAPQHCRRSPTPEYPPPCRGAEAATEHPRSSASTCASSLRTCSQPPWAQFCRPLWLPG